MSIFFIAFPIYHSKNYFYSLSNKKVKDKNHIFFKMSMKSTAFFCIDKIHLTISEGKKK